MQCWAVSIAFFNSARSTPQELPSDQQGKLEEERKRERSLIYPFGGGKMPGKKRRQRSLGASPMFYLLVVA